MQHPKMPSFADYCKHKNAQYPYDTSEDHPFALTHPDDFATSTKMLEQSEINGYPVNGHSSPSSQVSQWTWQWTPCLSSKVLHSVVFTVKSQRLGFRFEYR